MTLDSEIAHYFDRLWPLMRSLTGEGVRRTHDILSEIVPLERIEVPSGTQVFDWVVPKEWVFREAYVIAPDGRRILDASRNTLHLVNYSIPFRGRMSKAELDNYLFSLPDQPDAIPYVTSYYNPRWGFCLSQRERDQLPDGEYEVVVDTDHIDGSLTISEAVLPGEEEGEVLFSTYTCHPSMANNELSGPLVTAFLYRELARLPRRRLTYRFVFLPETIGSISYLSLRGEHLRRHLKAGYVVTCVGLDAPFTYKLSKRGDTLADRAALYALEHGGQPYEVKDFDPIGSDERQYCSPGFNFPVGSLMRGMYQRYPAYHTSLDNRDLISFPAMAGSVAMYADFARVLEANQTWVSLNPFGEPNLGKRGLYPQTGGKKADMSHRQRVHALLWLAALADGTRDLVAIARQSKIPLDILAEAAHRCHDAGLLAATVSESQH